MLFPHEYGARRLIGSALAGVSTPSTSWSDRAGALSGKQAKTPVNTGIPGYVGARLWDVVGAVIGERGGSKNSHLTCP